MNLATDPIERLGQLIADESLLDTKIHDTQVVLTADQKASFGVSRAALHFNARAANSIAEELMREEQSYERLLQALQDMKSEIAKQIRPVEEQIIQANVEHLRQTFRQESRRLSKSLEEIDDNILACRQYLQDYERIRSSLYALNEKIARLGGESMEVPDGLSTTDLGEIIRQRIDFLRSQGKI